MGVLSRGPFLCQNVAMNQFFPLRRCCQHVVIQRCCCVRLPPSVQHRKHQLIKEAASQVKNTCVFERTVMAATLTSCFEQLDTLVVSGLVGQVAESAAVSAALGAHCRVASQVKVQFVRFDVGDLLVASDFACLVQSCLQMDNRFGLLVTMLDIVDKPTPTTTILRPEGTWSVLLLPDPRVQHAACWHQRADGSFVALA